MHGLALGDAGVGDADLDRTVGFDGGGDLGDHVFLAAHVHCHAGHVIACDLVQHLLAAACDGHMCAPCGQIPRDVQPDAGAAARDQRVFSL